MADTLVSLLEPHMSVEERVAVVSPIINKDIQDFLDGKCSDGVQVFQERLLSLIKTAGLSDIRWVFVGKAGVHPVNRENTGLVPIDVHDLLRTIVHQGWSWREVDALGCEIPPTPEGQRWRDFNKQLTTSSDGLLAFSGPDALEILTVRGAHTTVCVRCYALGSKGLHPDLCVDGVLSKSKILSLQPSMSKPLEKGIPYLKLRWQLVQACPKLMEVLSRTGNAGHGVHRVERALQACNRIHSLAISQKKEDGDIDWEQVACQAAIGREPDNAKVAEKIGDFVRSWSGGSDGHILRELEAYEKTLQVKRAISPDDLQLLGKVDILGPPRNSCVVGLCLWFQRGAFKWFV